MATVSAFLIAVILILMAVMLVLIIIFIRGRRTLVATSSTPSKQACTSPPPTPINLSVSNPNSDILNLSWSRMEGASNYTAYISQTPNFNIANALQTRTISNNSVNFSNLTLGTVYYMKVRSSNSCGTSPLSNEVNFRLIYVFPRRFVINNLQNPQLKLCDTHDTVTPLSATTVNRLPSNQVIASRTCSLLGSLVSYQNRDRTIRQIDRPDACLTRVAPNILSFDPCVVDDRQTWDYSNQTNNVCGPQNNQCINLNADFTADLGNTNYGPPTTELLSRWLITPS